jgi:hypothetical protein
MRAVADQLPKRRVLGGKLRMAILNRMGTCCRICHRRREARFSHRAGVAQSGPRKTTCYRRNRHRRRREVCSRSSAYIRGALDEHKHAATSSARISAGAIQIQPPSLAAGETTDKGYINQRAVLKKSCRYRGQYLRRSNCVARYPAPLSSTSIVDRPGCCHFASDSGRLASVRKNNRGARNDKAN